MNKQKFKIGRGGGWEDDDTLMAGGSGFFTSGRIIYFKISGRVRAIPALVLSWRAAGAKGRPSIDEKGRPLLEPLLLYVYRHFPFPPAMTLALARMREVMAERGQVLDESEVNRHRRAGADINAFRDIIQDWLGGVFLDSQDAMQELVRSAATADAVAALEKSREFDKETMDFLSALEMASIACRGVPAQNDVQEQWAALAPKSLRKAGLTTLADARRGRDRFRAVRDKLGFAWLPAGRKKG